MDVEGMIEYQAQFKEFTKGYEDILSDSAKSFLAVEQMIYFEKASKSLWLKSYVGAYRYYKKVIVKGLEDRYPEDYAKIVEKVKKDGQKNIK